MTKRIAIALFLLVFQFSFTAKEITWVAIGDSITYLNDHPNETGNRITKGYMTQVVEKIPGMKFINKGFNGWTALRIATDIEKLGLPQADVYTVFLGTNDWWHGKPLGTMDDYTHDTGPSTIHGAFRVIINKLRSLNSKASIVLITPMKRVDFVYINNPRNNAYGSYREKNGLQLEAVSNAIVAIAKQEGIHVVDLFHTKGLDHKQLVNYKRLKDPSTGQYRNYTYPDYIDVPYDPLKDEYPYPVDAINVTYDGLHPSDKGYSIISASLLKTFRKLGYR